MSAHDVQIVGPDDVASAATRIAGLVIHTPLLRSNALEKRSRARVFLKAENLQTGGSFKLRGASHKIARLSAAEKAAGVVAWSSGNHAAAVAIAAERAGVAATIVMPADAPQAKRMRVDAAGARVIPYDRDREDREAIARAIADDTGAALIPSYDDADVVAGQGTAGLEMRRDAEDQGTTFDRVLVCCGGAGLVAGIGAAFAGAPTQVTAVEAETHAGLNASLRGGALTAVDPPRRSVCDALLATSPGATPFATARAHGLDATAVSDAEAMAAVAWAAAELKLVLEPGGAVALAALLSGRLDLAGETVGVVLSGGNVDPDVHARAWGENAPIA